MLRGGISNALFKVTPLLSPPSAPAPLTPMVFRVYGNGTDTFIDRTSEMRTMQWCHKHGFGPLLAATFEDGRIEGFLVGFRPLKPEEMAEEDTQARIARALARFHAIPLLAAPEGSAPPAPPAPAAGSAPPAPHAPSGLTKGTPFVRTREWLALAETLAFRDPAKKKAFDEGFDLAALRRAVDEVEAAAASFDASPVFAHNDVLSGNVMVLADGAQPPSDGAPTMTFIDYEYADAAPRAYDIGNHFCEYAGFDSEYWRYPDETSASRFCAAYLAEVASIEAEQGAGGEAAAAPASPAAVRSLVAEANVYALAAHAYWGAWCFIQAAYSALDFDYIEYGHVRWNEFFAKKDAFLKAAKEARQEA